MSAFSWISDYWWCWLPAGGPLESCWELPCWDRPRLQVAKHGAEADQRAVWNQQDQPPIRIAKLKGHAEEGESQHKAGMGVQERAERCWRSSPRCGNSLGRFLWRAPVQAKKEIEGPWPRSDQPRSLSLLPLPCSPLPLNITTDWHVIAITMQRKPTNDLISRIWK